MPTKKPFKIIAHRGASNIAPENTLVAFTKAVELGADAIEFDLHETLDRTLVVHHDYSLGNPNNGHGLIRETKYRHITAVDAGSWFGPKYQGERIPRLEEVLSTCGNTIDYEIELKGSTTDFIRSLLKVINHYRLLGQVEFTSPYPILLRRLLDLEPKAKCGMFCLEYPTWMTPHLGEMLIVDQMKLVGAQVAHLPQAIITKSLVKNLHQNNFLIHLADCNTKSHIQNALNYGCDQISTNNINLAVRMVKNYR